MSKGNNSEKRERFEGIMKEMQQAINDIIKKHYGPDQLTNLGLVMLASEGEVIKSTISRNDEGVIAASLKFGNIMNVGASVKNALMQDDALLKAVMAYDMLVDMASKKDTPPNAMEVMEQVERIANIMEELHGGKGNA